ncbi:zinc finger translocation-associated protein [Gadus macrocephalus]|uniref:zinc finger translocation-associated protein n=1 Tax=Gadus macrocephalus TaxID=80720 RepID=UPI0028CBA6CE|nr:zinc finger translocation-associated protein [Gadus macrocephalus]
MEEKDTGESDPVDLQCAEQTDLVSLIISGEEEATQEESDLGNDEDDEDDEDGGLANGHDEDESQSSMATPASSPHTSYWSVTEGPDQPLLLSPAPGPSGGGGKAPRVPRASRQGLSRIPGRDHRRYYHEYWRSEYLMDFDRLRQGMICMVCGSSLATLKLSTIKRHIRQKHPDSLLWSPADKEVIRSGWESHLGLGGAHKPFFPPEEEGGGGGGGGPMKVETMTTAAGTGVEEPSARTLERYLNDSLHAWFRQEFLMEYEAPAAGAGVSRLLCMVCGGQPHSLHLDHIKGHVLERHPDSLVYSAEEKHRVLQAWAHAHPEEEAGPFIKSERDAKDPEAGLSPQDAGYLQGGYALPPGHAPLTLDPGGVGGGGGGGLIGEDGIGGFGGAVAGTPDHRGPRGRGAPRRRRLRGGEPWRLRLDYLVAYGPQGRGTYCMVCSQALAETKVSGFRRHIQESHPETGGLGRKEREAMAAAWTKDYHGDHVKEELHPSELVAATATDGGAAAAAAGSDWPSPLAGGGLRRRRRRAIKKEPPGGPGEEGEQGGAAAPGSCAAASASSRHTHYPGKDQRRNYQVRWRQDFLMDYDCRRHGLICMVCGSTLATLKVSTIKRHIQQVHPQSLAYDAGERQHALLCYGRAAERFVHADDCFARQDHGHGGTGTTPTTPTGLSGT